LSLLADFCRCHSTGRQRLATAGNVATVATQMINSLKSLCFAVLDTLATTSAKSLKTKGCQLPLPLEIDRLLATAFSRLASMIGFRQYRNMDIDHLFILSRWMVLQCYCSWLMGAGCWLRCRYPCPRTRARQNLDVVLCID
jgi:hypothetical protein